MQPLPASTPPEIFARGKAIPHVIEAHQGQPEGIEAGHRARFDGIVRHHGIRNQRGEVVQVLVARLVVPRRPS